MTEPTNSTPLDDDPTETAVYKTLPRVDPHGLTDLCPVIEVEVVGGPMDGIRQRVSANLFSIGRGEQNDLQLTHDETISSRHARILREGEHYWLEDLDSKNGTYLGDERIHKRALIGPGTLFIVGLTCLEFVPR